MPTTRVLYMHLYKGRAASYDPADRRLYWATAEYPVVLAASMRTIRRQQRLALGAVLESSDYGVLRVIVPVTARANVTTIHPQVAGLSDAALMQQLSRLARQRRLFTGDGLERLR